MAALARNNQGTGISGAIPNEGEPARRCQSSWQSDDTKNEKGERKSGHQESLGQYPQAHHDRRAELPQAVLQVNAEDRGYLPPTPEDRKCCGIGVHVPVPRRGSRQQGPTAACLHGPTLEKTPQSLDAAQEE